MKAKRSILFLGVLSFLLLGCGESDEISGSGSSLSPFEYSTQICERRLGLESWQIDTEGALDARCIDGSRIYLRDYMILEGAISLE